jgi:hypothetical protein
MVNLDQITSSVLRVGDGRGFVAQWQQRLVIQGQQRFQSHRIVITAAHCLPFFPPCCAGSYTEERTFQDLLAPIDGEPSVWAECLFVDPISDIAVLCAPDEQACSDQYEQYESLVEPLAPIRIADAPEECEAWLLSLDKRWFPCVVKHYGGPLWLSKASDGIRGGMSGTPIALADGSAIGLVSISGDGEQDTEGGPDPRLTRNLPGWCLQAI